MTALKHVTVGALGLIVFNWTVIRHVHDINHPDVVVTVSAIAELLVGAVALWLGVRWHGVATAAAAAIALGAVAIALAPLFWITGMDEVVAARSGCSFHQAVAEHRLRRRWPSNPPSRSTDNQSPR
jgi:hypothetical protein